MTDDNKRYMRQRNTGAFPWEIESSVPVQEEHPVFIDTFERNLQSHQPMQRGACSTPLPDNFMPTAEILEFLQVHYSIPLAFIATALVDFRLYWQETGEARPAWQNRFKTHVIYQWKRSQHEAGQRTYRTTIEELTDRSWDDESHNPADV